MAGEKISLDFLMMGSRSSGKNSLIMRARDDFFSPTKKSPGSRTLFMGEEVPIVNSKQVVNYRFLFWRETEFVPPPGLPNQPLSAILLTVDMTDKSSEEKAKK